jgi:hypothetical protein
MKAIVDMRVRVWDSYPLAFIQLNNEEAIYVYVGNERLLQGILDKLNEKGVISYNIIRDND